LKTISAIAGPDHKHTLASRNERSNEQTLLELMDHLSVVPMNVITGQREKDEDDNQRDAHYRQEGAK
jgi:hypothetical protein